MYNICIIQKQIKKATEKKERKFYSFSVGLKAAFDKIGREMLWNTIENAGISKELVNRTRKIYIDTRNKINEGEKVSENFSTEEGVRVIHFVLRCL